MDQFRTQTNAVYASKKLLKQSILIFAGISAVCLLGLRVSLSFFLLLELMAAAVCLFVYQTTKRTRSWTLDFVDDELNLINNTTGESYNIYAVPTSDFVLRQSKMEKEMNCGTLKIKHTMFSYISGIENFREMAAYIQEHFSKYG